MSKTFKKMKAMPNNDESWQTWPKFQGGRNLIRRTFRMTWCIWAVKLRSDVFQLHLARETIETPVLSEKLLNMQVPCNKNANVNQETWQVSI